MVAAFLGIDPGASGGLALLLPDGGVCLEAMPATERDIWDWLRGLNEDQEVLAAIELVGGYVGGEGNTGSSMFKFGMGFGGLRMALTAAEIPFELVAPRVWQKAAGLSPRKKGEAKGPWKTRIKALAQRLCPGIGISLATADALLIARWCQNKGRANGDEAQGFQQSSSWRRG